MMYDFSPTAVKLLREYKAVIKKQMSFEEAEARLASLGLNKRLPKKDNVLYEILTNVLREETKMRQAAGKANLRYCGASQLLLHMRKVVELYRMENKKVVNANQMAAKAMIDAVQLIASLGVQDPSQIISKLRFCVEQVIQYGTQDQKRLFRVSLNTAIKQKGSFLEPVLEYYQYRLKAENVYSRHEAVCIHEDLAG